MKKLWILIFVLLGVFISSTALQAKPKKKKKKSKKEMADEKPKAPEYMVILVKGHDAYILKDYDKALDLYNDAAKKSPKSPKPHYFIGCAERALKNYDKAIGSFKTSYLMASDDKWWKGIASFNIAVTHEAAGNLKEARSAWEDFKRLAGESSFLKKYAETADSRIKAIDKYIELDEKYKIVRERIAK